MSSQEKESIKSLISRFVGNKGPWEKKKLLDAVYWLKLILCIILGTVVGVFGITGALGNILYVVVIAAGFHFYVSNVLKVNIEEVFGSIYGIATEGLLPTYCLYILIWSILYTALGK